MKKRFGILMCVLIIASGILVFFNNSSIKSIKDENAKLKSQVEALEKDKKDLNSKKSKLIEDKQKLEQKLKK
ncbi:hypothetical protein HAHI6034_03625 [Hathewaya histolytica]|uniref:Uncharacterized protein n=1 Tax=Hathewaya histolytica TaxID=1498 RepID=A0A4U9R5I1_HATHI|nr:hypothetical protein [Hathewaya histolytica]VTQ85771.1 Uncharacterised protein [Hathewaya histolytica]